MKKRFLAALFAVVMVLGLIGAVSAADPADPNQVTLEDSNLVLKKVKIGDIDPDDTQHKDDDAWMVIDGQQCPSRVDIPAYYDGLPVVAIGIATETYIQDKPTGDQLFYSHDGLTSVTIPETVRVIGDFAFAGTSLTSLTIPRSVKKIGVCAFQNCFSLRTVTFSENVVTEKLDIKPRAFVACTSLTSIDFPQHLTSIGKEAFYECTSLADVFIWSGKIEDEAFKMCGLENIVILTENVTIGPGAFDAPKQVAKPPEAPENFDEYPGAALFHYYKTNKINWPAAKSHLLKDMNKNVTPSTCYKSGTFSRFVMCDESDCDFSGNKGVSTGTIDQLKHDVPEPSAQELKLWGEEARTEQNRPLCEDFPFEYEKHCTRDGCSYTETGTATAEGDGSHDWDIEAADLKIDDPGFDPTAPEFDIDEELQEKLEVVPSTCATKGSVTWESECVLCHKTDEQTVELKLPDSNTHTFTEGNKKTITIPATCLYDGFEVTYYICDGADDKDHGDAVYKPCTPGGSLGTDVPCAEYHALIKAIEDLEKAAKAYTLPALSKPLSDITVTDLDTQTLADLRDAVIAAADAYEDHLYKDPEHKNNPDDCVAAKSTVTEPKDHSDDYLKSLGQEYRNPTNDGDYYCTEGGLLFSKDFCPYCGKIVGDDEGKPVDPKPHDVLPRFVQKTEATCTEPGKITYLPGAECMNKDCHFHIDEDKDPITIVDPTSTPKGHTWGDFVPDEGQDIEPREDCKAKDVTGTVTCDVCGVTEKTTIKIPGKAGHTWGEWVVTTPATPENPGEETRTCKVCGETDKRPLSYTPPEEPDEPDDPGPGGPGTDDPGTSTPDTTYYTITVIQGVNGSASASRSSATSGTSVTVTVAPASGYELDMLRITTDTSVVNTTSLGGGQYRFTMPAANVEIRASFSRIVSNVNANWTGSAESPSSSTTQTVVQSVPKASASEQLFRDIPATYWAAGEINWANQMGYMSGTNGSFNPDGKITHQQMWMVMARLTGSNPSSMADAKRWAVNGGFADGSAPEGPINRHQLVTALYRCAHLMGTSNRNTTSLAGFPDSRTVPIGAREPFAWAIANGIIGGNADGRLDPNGTITRAQFAVILYRFSQRV